MVAVNKKDWRTVKHVTLNNPVNTDPLVWSAMNTVVLGDTKGNVYAFSTADKAPGNQLVPVPLFSGRPGQPGTGQLQTSVSLADSAYQSGINYSQFSGVGTNPMLASGRTGVGLLLLGVNTSDNSGLLVAYRAGDPYNTFWKQPQLDLESPSAAIGPGSAVTIKGTVGIEPPFPAGKKLSIGWFLKGDDGTVWRLGSTVEDVTTLVQNQKRVEFSFKVDPAYSSGTVFGVVNESVVLISRNQPEGTQLRDLWSGAISGGFSTTWGADEIRDFLPENTDLSRLTALGMPAEYPVKAEMVASRLDGALQDNIGSVRLDIAENDVRLMLMCPPSKVDIPFLVMANTHYTSNTGRSASVELRVRYTDSTGQVRTKPAEILHIDPGNGATREIMIDDVAYGNVTVAVQAIVRSGLDDTRPENNSGQCIIPVVQPTCTDCNAGDDQPGARLNE